jgi:hypothetical protein
VVEGVTVEGTALKIIVDAYTKAETLDKIGEKITEINGGESAGEVLSKLNSYVESNNAEIAAIKTLVSEHTAATLPAITANTEAITKLNGDETTDGSVKKAIADAIANIPAINIATATTAGVVKAGYEVTVDDNGVLGIGYVSTDKLVQGSNTLVLNGGDATVSAE